MSERTVGARWRAVAAAALLLVAGGAIGVVVDRLWLLPPEIQADSTPLTVAAMAARLGLSSSEEARVQALLDSLHAQTHAALQQGPDSLRKAVRNARLRIEGALPPDARSEFRAWMQEHYEHMIGRVHGGPIDPGMRHGGRPGRAHTEDHDRPR